jgi:hypothetical protein
MIASRDCQRKFRSRIDHSDRRLAGLQDAGGTRRRASRRAFSFLPSTIVAFTSRLIFVDAIIV